MSLLILGNLYLTDAHKKYLKQLVGNVTQISKTTDGLGDIISKFPYVFCCNFNLNPYLENLSDRQFIVMAETGIVNIDVEKAQRKGITVHNLETYSCDAVVQYIMYCIMKELRPWDDYFSSQYNRNLVLDKSNLGLETLTVGIIGYGTIGRKAAKVLNAFGCNIIVNSRSHFSCSYAKYSTKENLFNKSDGIVVCCDLNDSSKEFIDAELLGKMKNNSILISISPRQVFNNKDLEGLLRTRSDIAAYLDFDMNDNDLNFGKLNNVNISPHLAFYTQQTILNRTDSCIKKLENHLASMDVTKLYSQVY